VTTNVARVGAYQDGRITLDGRDVPIEHVRAAFVKLSRNKGVVWYYREAADAEPHPHAMQVIEAIVEAGLAVSMSTKPDFLDVVLADGTTKPR
jgi:hypothetical protein